MTSRRPAAIVAVLLASSLLVASVLAGCSSDGSAARSSSTTEPTTSTEPTATTEPTAAAKADAAAAYVAGYPLVVSARTFQRLAGLVGVNRLLWQKDLSGPAARTIVAPNRDTLYSVAVLDLRSEPMVLTLPAVTDRYYTYQLLDAWTESFAYLGTRATAGAAGTWVITPPGWTGTLPPGTRRLKATTPQVLLLGRFLVADQADIANISAIAAQAKLQPLSALTGGPKGPPLPAMGTPKGTAQDIPTDDSFFAELREDLAVNPARTAAERATFDRVDGLPARELAAGAAAGDAEIAKGAKGAPSSSGWSVNLDVGRYGDDLLRRAVVARVGWGANVPEEAVYPVARTDADGRKLDGRATYRITFAPGELPPVEAFWSLSVYGLDLFFTPHPSGRYTLGDRTPGLRKEADGSLVVTLSNTQPPADDQGRAANWLPTPAAGFVLMLRLYLPEASVLDGTYRYPPIERVAG